MNVHKMLRCLITRWKIVRSPASHRPVTSRQIPDLDYNLDFPLSAIFHAKHDCAFKQRNCAKPVSQYCEEALPVPTSSAEDHLRYQLERIDED
jgi:hypothetical protein